MTSRIFTVLQTTFTIAFLFVIAGCEEPTPKAKQLTPPTAKENTETEASANSPGGVDGGEASEPEAVGKEVPEPNKPGYPYFHAYMDGETLVVDGALKSGEQVKQIGSELEEYFSKLKIENKLRKDPRRHAVGWGNRVGDAVLFDYFSYVTDPEIEYKEGVVTLRGSLADQKKLRIVTEMVIAGFSDVWTNDLVNEIKVGN